MAKRRTKAQQVKAQLLSEGYMECARCGKMLKPGTRRCPECGSLGLSAKRILAAAAIVATVVLAGIAVYELYPGDERYVPPPTVVTTSPTGYGASTSAVIQVDFNVAMDTASVEASFSVLPSVQGAFGWSRTSLRFTPTQTLPDDTLFTVTIGGSARDAAGAPLDCGSYMWSFSTANLPTSRRDIGAGGDDFWTVYPPGHPSAGETVSHPDWVTAALEQGSELIFDHSEGCYPCIQQTDICESAYASNPGLQYLDLLAGTDEPHSSQAFTVYDPNGGIHYVPLTILVTKADDGLGNEIVIWHSWEGVVDLVTLNSWIGDAQSYHDECA